MREFYLDYYNPHKVERAVYLFRAEPPIGESGVYGDFEDIQRFLKEKHKEGDRISASRLRNEGELEFLVGLFGKDNVEVNKGN